MLDLLRKRSGVWDGRKEENREFVVIVWGANIFTFVLVCVFEICVSQSLDIFC